MAADNAAAWPRDAEIPLTDVRSVPKTGLARPPPTQQTARKGRLNFLYAIALQWRDQRYPGIGRILWRAGMVNSAATVARQRRQSNLLLTPDLGEIDLLGWNQFERAVQLGYEETVRQLAASRR